MGRILVTPVRNIGRTELTQDIDIIGRKLGRHLEMRQCVQVFSPAEQKPPQNTARFRVVSIPADKFTNVVIGVVVVLQREVNHRRQ